MHRLERFSLLRVAVAAVLLALTAPRSDAAERYEWEGVSRIVSIGDVHGAYDNLVQILQNAKLIDEKLHWVGGAAHLVQNGDIVDRGPQSRKAMDLLMKLEDEAEDAGGRVHVLIGNHEAMNVVGILDLVSDEEYEAFADRNSRKLSDKAFERSYADIRLDARRSGKAPPLKQIAKQEFLLKYPLGYIEHRRAFDPDGRYGKWITRHNTAIKINGILFSHGDWSEKFADIGIAAVNDTVRDELKGERPLEDGLAFDELSPLQYRGFANVSLTRVAQAAEEATIERVLTTLDATRMVVGHTLTSGVIESRYGGRHISLDVGILELYRGGHRIALEITGDQLRAIHDGGSVPIPETMDETNFSEYVLAVSKVDPDNLDVQLQLVDTLVEQERFGEAVPLLEKALTRPEFVPFRYRDLLGREYEKRGQQDKANAQFQAYIDGLGELVESNPRNGNLANLLARYAATKGMALDRAESAIQGAIENAPTNSNFRVTLAKVWVAQGRYAEALELLNSEPAANEPSYDARLVAGMAHVGLGAIEAARAEFESAIETDPTRSEALEELAKLGEER